MTQQIAVEPPEIRAPVRESRRPGPSKSKSAPHSAKRVFVTLIVALLFAFAVIVGLVYLVNSAAYQSTDDALLTYCPVSRRLQAGQSVTWMTTRA
jgi:hypothetical protein